MEMCVFITWLGDGADLGVQSRSLYSHLVNVVVTYNKKNIYEKTVSKAHKTNNNKTTRFKRGKKDIKAGEMSQWANDLLHI